MTKKNFFKFWTVMDTQTTCTEDDKASTCAVVPEGVTLTYVYANGIRHRIATAGWFGRLSNCNENIPDDCSYNADDHRINISGNDDGAQARRRRRKRGGGAGRTNVSDASFSSFRRPSCRHGQKPPLIMLLHGWPELWYSYRHQLIALASRGYAVCAPDMRGYGGTDDPPHDGTNNSNYTIPILTKDVLHIAKYLDYDQFVLVGHDFGAYLAWHMALLYPHNVLAICAMSVPYVGHTPRKEGLLSKLQRQYYGGCCLELSPEAKESEASRKEREETIRQTCQFHYMLYHTLPYAAEEYDKNVGETLYRIYAYQKGVECEEGTPEIKDKRMFSPGYRDKSNNGSSNNSSDLEVKEKMRLLPTVRNGLDEPTKDYKGSNDGNNINDSTKNKPNSSSLASPSSPVGTPSDNKNTQQFILDARDAPGLWMRLPRPKSLPTWLTPLDLQYYIVEFQHCGFAGGLKWYQALNDNWTLTRHLRNRKILQPVLFLAGTNDDVIQTHGGPDVVEQRLKENCLDLRECVFYNGAGHWIQQERWEDVNNELLAFLKSVVPVVIHNRAEYHVRSRL